MVNTDSLTPIYAICPSFCRVVLRIRVVELLDMHMRATSRLRRPCAVAAG